MRRSTIYVAAALTSLSMPSFAQTSKEAAETIALVEKNMAEVLKNPGSVKKLECMGIKVYQDPQPPGHPPPKAECDRIMKAAASPQAAPAPAQKPPQPAQEFYRSRYFLAGYFLRSGNVCDENSKQIINTSLELIGSDKLRKVGEAFPQLTEEWMQSGAANFNGMAMKSGIADACAYAVTTARQARSLPKGP